MTLSSPKFLPVFIIRPNFRQNLRKFCRKINRKSVSSLSSKDFTLKSFWTVPHFKTLEVSIDAFIRMLITGSKSQPTIYYQFCPLTRENAGIIGSIPCGCIKCITASVPPALIVPFNSDLEIYPFVTSHAVWSNCVRAEQVLSKHLTGGHTSK